MFRILLSSKCFAVSICEMHCSACLPLPGQKKKTNKTNQLNILRYIQLFGVYITYSVRLDQQSYYSVFKNTYNRLHKHKIRKKHELINTNYFLSPKKIQPKAERERERIQEQDLTVSLSLSLLCYYEYLHNPIPSNAGVLFALILFFFPLSICYMEIGNIQKRALVYICVQATLYVTASQSKAIFILFRLLPQISLREQSIDEIGPKCDLHITYDTYTYSV